MPDDRDQLFEKALARHLRGEDAGESVCLDPETLAAYDEHMLSPEELSVVKSHIVSCARCQEILAHLESTQDVDAVAAAPGEVSSKYASHSARLEFAPEDYPEEVDFDPASSAGRTGASAPPARQLIAASAKVTRSAAKKSSSFRWIAPAGALAAGILLLFSVRTFQNQPKSAPQSNVQVAQSDYPAAPYQAGSPQSEKQQQSGAQLRDGAVLDEELKAKEQAPPPPADLRRQTRDEKGDLTKDTDLARNLPSHDNLSRSREYAPIVRPAPGPTPPAAQNQTVQALQRSDQKAEQRVGDKVAVPAKPSAVPGSAEVASAPQFDGSRAEPAKSGAAGGALASKVAPPPPPYSTPSAMKKLASGRLYGTVTDPSGAAVSGANVVLKSSDGGAVASTSTDRSGTYSFDSVAAGNYQLELQSTGFKTDVLTGLNVAAGENVINAKLQVGAVAETVEVAGAATVTNSRAAENSAISLGGRNVRVLALPSSSLHEITSADGKSIWKFGEAGQIFHSSNAGKNWSPQTSGVTSELLAASAPSAKVCWIAGAAGTLLRTTDGGKHWRLIRAPVTTDFGGVSASDAQHASIWDASKPASYETSDGGVTWKQGANE